jgi:bleomycin hydrolase
MKLKYKILPVCLSFSCLLFAQNKDKAEYINVEPGFYQNSILKDISTVKNIQETKAPARRFQMVQDSTLIPHKLADYKFSWCNIPVSQGNTGTCWCFSTTSFYESEIKRLYNKEVRLSEMFTVYCEYIEKARRFIRERGVSEFGEGSEGNAVKRIFKQYGAMPSTAFIGLPGGLKFYNHEQLFNEMDSFLISTKQNNVWNETWVIETIKCILDKYIGTPPSTFVVEGKEFTPATYLKNYLKLNPDDYIDILSYKQEPFWKQVEYKVPDNWWHNADYYNVPLNDYMAALKKAIRSGYTICIGGDVSEPGLNRYTQAAMIPDFDIPSQYINDDARQFRFTNQTTTDDHGLHIVGYCERNGKDWYLVKDSGSGSRNNNPNAPEFGYFFFHEDYVKLKIMDFTIHKDAVKELLSKF